MGYKEIMIKLLRIKYEEVTRKWQLFSSNKNILKIFKKDKRKLNCKRKTNIDYLKYIQHQRRKPSCRNNEIGKKNLDIGILTNIPTPYRKTMWEKYSEIKNTQFDVYYCKSIERDRKWEISRAKGVNEYFLKGITFGISNHLNFGVIFLARKYNLWLIGGYSMLSSQLLIIACKIFKIPYVIMFDGISPLKIHKKENKFKFTYKKFLVKRCKAFLGNGKVGKLYGEKLGIPEKKIFNQYLTVDIDYFFKYLPQREDIDINTRKILKIPINSFVILYVGRLVKHKGIQDLIFSYKKLLKEEEKPNRIYIVIIGHGKYENELKKISHGMRNIIFVGNVNYLHIYKYYFSSDVFILPTYNDPWGLVINEAMACGLPIVTTRNSGASLDLVKGNGYIYDAGDVNKLADILFKITHDSELRNKMSCKSLDIIKNYSFQNARQELELLLKKVNKDGD